jgi:hypothetical protein
MNEVAYGSQPPIAAVEDAVTHQQGFAVAALRVLKSTKRRGDDSSVNGRESRAGSAKITPIAPPEEPAAGERAARQRG